MTTQADDFLALTDAMVRSLAGDDPGPELIEVAERVVAAGLLPQFGRAALTLLLNHRMAYLLTRRAVILADMGKPSCH